MANPQIENGYTRIANELLEAMCSVRISGNELRIFLYIIRMTYGYSRKSAEISLSDIARAVKMSSENVSKMLKKLIKAGLVDYKPNRGIRPRILEVQKDYEKWHTDNGKNEQQSETTIAENEQSKYSENEGQSVVEKNDDTVVSVNEHTYYKEKKENNTEKGKEREPHGRYGNILLTSEEFGSLADEYGRENVERYISKADSYVQATGSRYVQYEPLIRKWLDDDGVKNEPKFDSSKYDFVINRF